MIRVKSITAYQRNSVEVSLFADTKAEVGTTPLENIEGFPKDISKIAMGSSVLTASGDLAFMKSDGTWNWI